MPLKVLRRLHINTLEFTQTRLKNSSEGTASLACSSLQCEYPLEVFFANQMATRLSPDLKSEFILFLKRHFKTGCGENCKAEYHPRQCGKTQVL